MEREQGAEVNACARCAEYERVVIPSWKREELMWETEAAHLRAVLRDIATFNFTTLEDVIGAARAALEADGKRSTADMSTVRQEVKS